MSPKEIVYFVGAGLSKALERPGKRIPLMYDFVDVMADYAPRDKAILQTLARLEYAGIFIWASPEASDLAKVSYCMRIPVRRRCAVLGTP